MKSGRFSRLSISLAHAFFLVFAILAGRGAWGNANIIEYDTSVGGQLVPQVEDEIQVRDEQLNIDIKMLPMREFGGMPHGQPMRVEVTARYRLYNPSSVTRQPLLAFPILRNVPEERLPHLRDAFSSGNPFRDETDFQRGMRTRVSVNGTSISATYLSFEHLFEKQRPRWVAGVRAWLAQWPEIAKAAEPGTTEPIPLSSEDDMDFYRLIYHTQFTTTTTNKLMDLVRRQRMAHPRIDEWDLDVLSFLYHYLNPQEKDEVAQFQALWGLENEQLKFYSGERYAYGPLNNTHSTQYDLSRLGRLIDFLQYRPVLPSRKETVVEVRYSHLLDSDLAYETDPHGSAPTSFNFQYILRTSPRWKTFGPIHLTLAIPCIKPYSISLPVQYKGEKEGRDVYTAEIEGSKARENLHLAIRANDLGKYDDGYSMPEIGSVNLLTSGGKIISSDPTLDEKLDTSEKYPSIYVLPKARKFRAEWDYAKAHRDGPFYDNRLYLLAMAVRYCHYDRRDDYGILVTKSDVDWLATELKLPDYEHNSPKSNIFAAIHLLRMIPSRYPTLQKLGMDKAAELETIIIREVDLK